MMNKFSFSIRHNIIINIIIIFYLFKGYTEK